MALIRCKECGKEVSDKADKCPNCGCPVSYSLDDTEDEKENTSEDEWEEWKPSTEEIINNTKDKIKRKDSVLSVFAFIVSILGCGILSVIGLLLAIMDLCKKDKTKNHRFSWWAIVISIILTIIACNIDSNKEDNVDDSTTTESQTTEIMTESTTEKEYTFDDKVKELLGEEPGNNLLKILKDDIGFTELSSIEKVDDTLNYKINANEYELMVTEISDTDFRVIIPNSDYVFYENGSVSMTFKDFSDRQIDINDRGAYYIMAQEIVKSGLKNPSSADFPSITFHSEDIAMQKKGDLVVVQSYVDAENSFGGTVRSNWTVQFMVIDMDSFSCEPTYISIDGNETGEFINMD